MHFGGIVLAGGESRRMGKENKACLTLDGVSFLDLALSRVAWCEEVFLSAKDEAQYHLEHVTLVADIKPLQGPLMGMYSVFNQSNYDAYVVTSVDTPFVTEALLIKMSELLGDFDAVIPRDHDYTHPLCGIYHRRCISAFESALSLGMKSPNRVIKTLNVKYIEIAELEKYGNPEVLLANINTKEEYDYYHLRRN